MTRWVFLYAANSDPVSAALDWAHKLVSPATYACSLCRVTHGAFGAKAEWKDALSRLAGEKEFYHRDEFHAAFPDRPIEAPSVWRIDDEVWHRVVGPQDWGPITDVATLERFLTRGRHEA